MQTDYSVEVVRAPTLGSVFGETASDLDLNPSSANGSDSAGADFCIPLQRMFNMYHMLTCHAGSGRDAGWYSSYYMRWGRRNHLVIYPDEGFIVAKRTSGTANP